MAPKLQPGRGMDKLFKIATVLLIVGGINWGLIGLFNFNLVDAIFGGGSREETSNISRVVYALVGLSALLSGGLLPRVHTPERHPTVTTAR